MLQQGGRSMCTPYRVYLVNRYAVGVAGVSVLLVAHNALSKQATHGATPLQSAESVLPGNYRKMTQQATL